jgi:hypothetical protein
MFPVGWLCIRPRSSRKENPVFAPVTCLTSGAEAVSAADCAEHLTPQAQEAAMPRQRSKPGRRKVWVDFVMDILSTHSSFRPIFLSET